LNGDNFFLTELFADSKILYFFAAPK